MNTLSIGAKIQIYNTILSANLFFPDFSNDVFLINSCIVSYVSYPNTVLSLILFNLITLCILLYLLYSYPMLYLILFILITLCIITYNIPTLFPSLSPHIPILFLFSPLLANLVDTSNIFFAILNPHSWQQWRRR